MASQTQPKRKARTCPHRELTRMDMTRTLQHITELHTEQMRGLRHIARRQESLIALMEKKRNAWHRVFLSRMWNAFSEQLATNLGKFLAGLLLWLLAAKILGLDQIFERLSG